MASLDIFCSDPLNLKNKITKTEHKKISCGPSKVLKNISWPISICLKYFMTIKILRSPSYILNVRSLNMKIGFNRIYLNLGSWQFRLTFLVVQAIVSFQFNQYFGNILTMSEITSLVFIVTAVLMWLKIIL